MAWIMKSLTMSEAASSKRPRLASASSSPSADELTTASICPVTRAATWFGNSAPTVT
jgi:hypothetical protein